MATEAGELLVKISADVSDIKSALKEMSDGISKVGADTVAKGTLMADAFKELGRVALDFAKNSILAFGEQEQSLARLSFMVGTEAAKSFETLAEQIQKTTTFSDSEVIALQAQLAMFGLTADEIKNATGALINYAAYSGKTLPEAGQVLGQALAGNARELNRMGIEIFATDTRADKLSKTVNFLNKNFDGMAQQLRDTTLGAIAGMTNNFNQLEQEVGHFLSSPAVGFTQWISGFIQHVTDSLRIITQFSSELGGLGNMFKAVFIEMGRDIINFLNLYVSKLSALGPILKFIGIDMDAIAKKLNTKLDLLQKDINQTERSTAVTVVGEGKKLHAIDATTRAVDEYISALQHSILVAQAVNTKITEITTLETQKRLLDSQNSYEANASFSDQLRVKMADDIAHNTSAWVDMAEQMMDSFANSTAKMIVEGGKFSDVIRNLWIQIAEQVIAQIIRMIAQWLVWQAMTGGVGGAFGGFMAEGGMINEPSLIVGLRSGSKHIAGEAGPEMVVPTGQSGANYATPTGGGASMGGGGGSSEIHVHISGQFIEGSPSKWQRMIQEQIAPQIRRLAMKDPNSLITRKRGANS